jgi:hypothetical protein
MIATLTERWDFAIVGAAVVAFYASMWVLGKHCESTVEQRKSVTPTTGELQADWEARFGTVSRVSKQEARRFWAEHGIKF